jgi:hypothetical protein
MTERSDLWAGGWWRFTKYEIRGEHIGPSADASLEWYDPWQQYNRSLFDSGTAPPYQSLLKLATELPPLRGDPDGLQATGPILDWCNRFGLLGMLPHTAIRIDLPIRLLASTEYAVQVRRSHVRTSGRWLNRQHASRISAAFLQPKPRRDTGGDELLGIGVELRAAVLSQGESKEHLSRAVAEVMDVPLEAVPTLLKAMRQDDLPLGDFLSTDDPDYTEPEIFLDGRASLGLDRDVRVRPLTTVLHQYFPDFMNEGAMFECPLPLTPDFWWRYRESFKQFRLCAMGFLTAAGGADSRPALGHLESLIAPAGVSLSRGPEHRIQETWTCPSLLSSLARMLIQDILAGRRILRCDCCGSPFVTDNYQARYCSRRCGFRFRQRRARAKASKTASPEDQNGKEAR